MSLSLVWPKGARGAAGYRHAQAHRFRLRNDWRVPPLSLSGASCLKSVRCVRPFRHNTGKREWRAFLRIEVRGISKPKLARLNYLQSIKQMPNEAGPRLYFAKALLPFCYGAWLIWNEGTAHV